MSKKNESKLEPTQIALFQIPDLPEPFRKAVPAVHIAPQAGPISLQQAKMFNALIKNAIEQNKEGERVWFEYAVTELISDVGLNTKNRDYVKSTINSLIGLVVNWDHLSGTPVWNASGLVAGAKLAGSTLRYQFSENIREILMNPRIYASIDMRIAREFKRGHSLTLWENVVRYEGVGRTPRLSVDTLRDLLLGMEWKRGSYAQYKTFKSRVLLPAIEEINRIADHEVELVEFKVGRTVADIQFIIREKRKADTVQEDDLELLTAMTRFDIPLTEARKLLAEHGATAVQKAIKYTDQRVIKKNAQPIENVGAYFRKALQAGWQSEEQRTHATSGVIAMEARQGRAEDQLLAKYQAYRATEAQSYFNELNVEEQNEYVSKYNDQAATQLKILAGKKIKKTAESSFFNWLAEQVWGKPTDRDLLNFLLKDAAVGAR
ncbi:replication initiation protein [Paraburkholderia sp. J41]|uniref:replication initiation protein n=1 Tax=Paraburkholderia sp. J41 TaxID=2805433 RepID=UPI002AC36FAA|nr:replication initiation protein [Paraburkholderia sp. J41]